MIVIVSASNLRLHLRECFEALKNGDRVIIQKGVYEEYELVLRNHVPLEHRPMSGSTLKLAQQRRDTRKQPPKPYTSVLPPNLRGDRDG